jgi:hypothetical protein
LVIHEKNPRRLIFNKRDTEGVNRIKIKINKFEEEENG